MGRNRESYSVEARLEITLGRTKNCVSPKEIIQANSPAGLSVHCSRNDTLRTVYFTIQRKAGPPWNSHAYRHRRKISHELN